MESKRKFLTSVRLYPTDVEYLKVLAAENERTVAFYIQKAVAKFVQADKRKKSSGKN